MNASAAAGVIDKTPDCMHWWFANGAEIPGEATVPPEAAQPEVECVGQSGSGGRGDKFPWMAPGGLGWFPTGSYRTQTNEMS